MAYRVNTQKSNVSLYASKEQLEVKNFKEQHQKYKILRDQLNKKTCNTWALKFTKHSCEKSKNIKRNADVYHAYGLGN